MASTTSDLVRRARLTLCDPDAKHWTDEELLAYLNEAVCELAGLRPDEFTSQTELALVPGRCQTVPEGCDLVSVQGDCSGEDPGITRATSTAGDRLGAKFLCRDDVCPDAPDADGGEPTECAIWRASSFRVTPASRGYFMIDPPVPDGCSDITVTAMVYCMPERLPLGDDPECVMPCSYDAQLVDFILMRAFEKDIDSVSAQQRASYHRRSFYQGVNADYRMASRRRSGYILGETGHGNEQSGWRNEIRGVFE